MLSTLLGSSSAAHTFSRHRPRVRRALAHAPPPGFVAASAHGRVSLRRVDPVRRRADLVVQPQLRKRTFGHRPVDDCDDVPDRRDSTAGVDALVSAVLDAPERSRGGSKDGLGALGSAVVDAWSAIAAHDGVKVVHTTRTDTTYVYAGTPAAEPTPPTPVRTSEPTRSSMMSDSTANSASRSSVSPASRSSVSVTPTPTAAAIDGTPLEIAQADGVVQDAGEASGAGTTSFGVWALDDSAIAFGYFIDVSIGGKPFSVQLDSSSADFWVGASDCVSCARSHAKLSPARRDTSQTWSASYSANALWGSSELTTVSGDNVSDSLTIAGLTLSLPFGVATSVTNEYASESTPFDGVLGCANAKAFPGISMQGNAPVVQALASAGKIERAQIGVWVGRPGQAAGELALGGIDASKYVGPMVVMDSVSKFGYWEAPVGKFSLGDASITAKRTSIFDTRSVMILLPKADIQALLKSWSSAVLDPSEGLIVPCNTDAKLSFTFESLTITLKPSDLVFLPVPAASRGKCSAPPCCYSTVQPVPAAYGLSGSQLILGDAFLRSAYLAMDFTAGTVGLAKVRST